MLYSPTVSQKIIGQGAGVKEFMTFSRKKISHNALIDLCG
jgi:hypothetical protein